VYCNGPESWYVHGQLHRLDGPAIMRPEGSQWWWIQGVDVTTLVCTWMAARQVSWPWDVDTQMEFLLAWS
jgi:hypothetical protein